MNKTFKEKYIEEQQLEHAIANKWGYQITSPIDLRGKKNTQQMPHILANITLRKFNNSVIKSDRIDQIDREILAMHNERILMERNQLAAQQAITNKTKKIEEKSLIIKMMEEKIGEYNYLVEHKHIIDKGSEESRRIFNLESKTEATKIIEQINIERQKMMNAEMKEQYYINKHIAKLYRAYKEKMYQTNDKPHSQRDKPYTINVFHTEISKDIQNQNHRPKQCNQINSMLRNQNQTENHFDIKSKRKVSQDFQNSKTSSFKNTNTLNQQNQKNGKIDKIQLKRVLSNNPPSSKQSRKLSKTFYKNQPQQKVNFENELKEPFVEKKITESFRNMENKIQSNRDALELWKSKIQEKCNKQNIIKKIHAKQLKIQKSNKKIKDQSFQRQNQLYSIIQKDIQLKDYQEPINPKYFKSESAENYKKKQMEQESIFSDLLKKKHTKFNKLWGTKILVKYNADEQAKKMLRGVFEKKQSSKTERKYQNNLNQQEESRQKQKKQKKEQIEKQIVQEDELDWLNKQVDHQHYWRMCKNEKINLLLKGKR